MVILTLRTILNDTFKTCIFFIYLNKMKHLKIKKTYPILQKGNIRTLIKRIAI